MDRLKLLGTLVLRIFLGCSNQDKGEKMKETYEIQAINGTKIPFDKQTNLMIPKYELYKGNFSKEKYLKPYSEFLIKAQSILSSSPYSTYTPSYLNPNDSRDRSYFLGWRDLYLKEPAKGSIAPWSKEEKEYYLSLKSKKERYIYLVKRSGLKCAIIDIPEEAIGNAKDFPEITALVEANRNTLKSDLHMGEWGICAGILGDAEGFTEATAVGSERAGFKARSNQALFLYYQLTGDLVGLSDSYEFGSFTWGGVDERPLKASLLKAIEENPPVDEYGMIPFLDELIELDWIMDFNKFPYGKDTGGYLTQWLDEDIKAGKLLDPREARADKKTREEFRKTILQWQKEELSGYDAPYHDDMSEEQVNLNIDISLLEAKIMAVTPPQGYINAPYYYFPEELDELFEAGKLDRKLDPTIPAYKRVGFPQDLVKKIEEFKERK